MRIYVKKMQQYIKYYNDTILNSTKGKFTNLNEIINKLRDKAYLGDNNTIYTNLYFISDFEHEEESGASFTEFNVNLHSLNEVKINQINLIKIKGKNNNTENVNTTLKLFRENFSHLYFYEFNEDLMYYDKKPVDAISSIFSSTTFDESQQAIYLYYLWNDANIHYDFIGNLTLNSNNSIKTIVLGLRDKIQTTNYNDYSGYLLLNDSKDKVFSFSSNQIP
jgi:hypothetical protein